MRATVDLSLSAAALAGAIQAALPAAALDGSRHVLCGVALDVGIGTVTAVATDGRRLHAAEIEVASADASVAGRVATLPRAAAKRLAGLLGQAGGDVRLALGAQALVAEWGGGEAYRARLVDAPYPGWRQVVPEPKGGPAEVDATALGAALARARALHSPELHGGGVPVSLGADVDGALRLRSFSNAGCIEESVKAEGVPESLAATMDADYLAAALGALAGNGAKVWFGDGGQPALVREEGTGRMAVVMPMRN